MFVVGSHRCLPSKRGGYTNGTFHTIVLANNVIIQSKEVAPSYTAQDVKKIKKFGRSKEFVSGKGRRRMGGRRRTGGRERGCEREVGRKGGEVEEEEGV